MTKTLVRTCLLLFLIPCAAFIACGNDDTVIQSLMDISGAPLGYDDSGATRRLAIASVCMECSRDKQENLAGMQEMIERIMREKPQTQLIVFGETILGWYSEPDDPAYQRNIAEPLPGPTSDSLAILADRYDIHIVFGIGELAQGQLYNSQVLLDPNGQIQAVHRKHRLLDEDRAGGFTDYPRPEENVTVTEIEGIRTGMIICADVGSYWLTRSVIARGAELILHSLASFEPRFPIDAVARQFNAWVVFANRTGWEKETFYHGNCFISDPAGTIRVGGNGGQRYEYYEIGVY
ncbi:carbon-nitrogen hydrolase family protein [candidate division KSB1 bacterium]|nr:carbon-nitrogen hydrolase family protein [candidate division KSB1 bacterium]